MMSILQLGLVLVLSACGGKEDSGVETAISVSTSETTPPTTETGTVCTTGRVHGVVTELGKRGAEGALIYFYEDGSAEPAYETRAGEDGAFDVSVPVGSYLVDAEDPVSFCQMQGRVGLEVLPCGDHELLLNMEECFG